jgi:hypothetical protein
LSSTGFRIREASFYVFKAMLVPRRRWKTFADELNHEREIETDLSALASTGIYGTIDLCAYRYDFDEGLSVAIRREPATTVGIVLVDKKTLAEKRVSVLPGLNVSLRDLTVDELICVELSALVPARRRGSNETCHLSVRLGCEETTLSEVLAAMTTKLECVARRAAGPFRCLEVRDVVGYELVAPLIEDNCRECYGLVTCDEGWRFVPAERVGAIVGVSWGTRDYLRVIAQPGVVVAFNLVRRRRTERMESATTVGEFANLTLPHVDLRSDLAGLDHAVLPALVRCAQSEVLVDDLWCELTRLQRRLSFRRWLDRGKVHRTLISGLLQLSTYGITEVAQLQSLVNERAGLNERESRLRDVAELVDSDLRERRAFVLNVGVALLAVVATVAGIVAALKELGWIG